LSACAGFYARVHPQLLAEQALSFAGTQKSAQKRQHREKLIEKRAEDAAPKN
jgi:hypothetical protein